MDCVELMAKIQDVIDSAFPDEFVRITTLEIKITPDDAESSIHVAFTSPTLTTESVK